MAFQISGYVLEPIRVGQANSPYTQTPDNYISNQVAFDAAYPSDESEPRNDYLVLLTSEGTPQAGLLVNAEFGWTKNEITQRFDYEAEAGRFRPLPGNAVTELGLLTVDANTNRFVARAPDPTAPVAASPYRLSVGSTGSGTAWTVTIVALDTDFSPPAAVPSGTAELSLQTGHLNWHDTDLITYSGQLVRWQQQQFFGFRDGGSVGVPNDTVVLLNPIPGTGQYPLLRFGFSLYLTTVEVPNESSFTPPPQGTVQWALDTGRLNFNATDITTYTDVPVYYDGVLFARDLTLPRQNLGDIATPSAITGLPPEGVDLIFSLPNATPYYQFPRFSYIPAALFNSGKTGVVQVDPVTGDVKFSNSDQSRHSGETVTVVFGDLPIERGISVRLLRTPVNLDASLELKDVTAIYSVENATWADPIIESPQVFLPSTPIDDATTYPLVVRVEQGTGTYTADPFPRLDVASPPVGLGYYIDFDERTLYFAQRKNQLLVPLVQPSSDVALPDPLVLSSNLVLEIETGPGTGTYTPLVLGDSALFDPIPGVVSLINNHGQIVAEGIAAFSGTAFVDPAADFVAVGVQPGYLIEVASSAAEGVYTVVNVVSPTELETDVPAPAPVVGAIYNVRRSREILADRYFDELTLPDPSTKVERLRSIGTATNAPRLNIPVIYITSSGFRFGAASAAYFATVVLVPTDGDFTSPPAGTVEISEATGNLNFSTADLGLEVFWMRELVPKVDYTMSAGLGLIQFTDRMLSLEEILVTYTTQPPSTDPPTSPDPPVQEYGTFLIRKEVTQDHPLPTSTLSFNIAGLDVADDPVPAVFRGGRPQELGVQCTVDTTASTITFLADDQITDALPHGATVEPSERVYIDYHVTQAVGGEKTITVLNPPILTSEVNISELDDTGNPNNEFTVHGDHTASFPPDYLLRIENEEIYLIGSSVYNPTTDETTVTLYGNQEFQNSYNDPTLYTTSGVTPIVSAPLVPAYFTVELQAYEAVARGSNSFFVSGDRTLAYRTGTVLMFTDGTSSFTDFLQVSGADYDPDMDRTTVTMTANALRQYISGSQILMYSVRPVFEPPTVEVKTSQDPVLTEPYVVYRRVENEPGVILSAPLEFTIDESGRVVFAEALGPSEEFSIFYTGRQVYETGINLRASYTHQVVPNTLNGLAGQILRADYYILSSDTFYYRVETMTNFRAEYAQEISAEASSGSSGPQTSNASQPQLYEQGRPSLYFDEKHLANQDIIARSTLLFYNDSVNLLEAYLRALDGRVVGNNDGELLFDGTTGIVNPSGKGTFPNNTTLLDIDAEFTTDLIGRTLEVLSGANKYEKREIVGVPTSLTLTLAPPLPAPPPATDGKYRVLAANQIDDAIQISPAPYEITYPPFEVTSIGTYQKYYISGSLSRFYPTSKAFYGVSAVTDDTETGDEVLDTGSTDITTVLRLHTRLAWATVVESTVYSGSGTLVVDEAEGSQDFARPPFQTGMECLVRRRDGTFINDSSSPVTVTGITPGGPGLPDALTITGLADVADVGTTIYRSPIDTSTPGDPDNLTYYLFGRDYAFNSKTGQIVYIEAIAALSNTPLIKEQALSGVINLVNTLTAPDKFPALYGGVADDDGDLSFPIQSPDPNSESNGYLLTEDLIIHNPTGILRSITTPPLVSQGDLDPARTTITDLLGAYPPPLPEVHDLVRILTGPNGPSPFVRVTAVTPNTITVDTPFPVQDFNFTYEIAVSASTVTGVAAFPDPITLNDAGASFLTTAKVGYTVVMTGGLNVGVRRQIVAVLSNTDLTLDPAMPSLLGGSYRIDDSLATYGGSSGDYLKALDDALSGQLALYPDEQTYILDFLNQVFTDVFTSATGQTTATQPELDDVNGTFITSGVSLAYCVYVETGANANVYQITDVISETQLKVDPVYPATQVGMSYRIVSLFGASRETAQALFAIYQSIQALINSAAAFQTLITTSVPVIRLGAPDPDTFARGTLTSDLDARDVLVDDRINNTLPADVITVEDVLANTDKFYDGRYAWIDTRINLKSGLIVQQATAEENRVQAQEDFYNQLIKLLAVEES